MKEQTHRLDRELLSRTADFAAKSVRSGREQQKQLLELDKQEEKATVALTAINRLCATLDSAGGGLSHLGYRMFQLSLVGSTAYVMPSFFNLVAALASRSAQEIVITGGQFVLEAGKSSLDLVVEAPPIPEEAKAAVAQAAGGAAVALKDLIIGALAGLHMGHVWRALRNVRP